MLQASHFSTMCYIMHEYRSTAPQGLQGIQKALKLSDEKVKQCNHFIKKNAAIL